MNIYIYLIPFISLIILALAFYIRRKFNLLYTLLSSVAGVVNNSNFFGFYRGVPITLDEWSLEVNALHQVYQEIIKFDRPVILELGSGKSSILLTYFLREFSQNGILHSIEHDQEFLSLIEKFISKNDCQKYWNAHDVPLVKTTIQEKSILTYSMQDLGNVLQKANPDIVIIDGPPVSLSLDSKEKNTFARSMLHHALEKLQRKPILFIDDANRPGEMLLIENLKKIGYTASTYKSAKGFVKMQ